MARKVFFSFHYKNDIRRVVQVRNSWKIRPGNDSQPFLDRAEWEQLKRTSDQAVENWIEKQLNGTSVTVVLIGSNTFDRKWVRHEIERSYKLKKGMLVGNAHSLESAQPLYFRVSFSISPTFLIDYLLFKQHFLYFFPLPHGH